MYDFDKEEYLISLFDTNIIGDDGAIVGEMIYSMDAFNEDTHFKREWMSMTQIGTKAMLVNISDAVAMNAKPKYALISISLPAETTKAEIRELVKAMKDTAQKYECTIIGGDTVSSQKLNISITIISTSSKPLKRAGMMSDDLIAYTGEIGQSKVDLEKLFNGEVISQNSRFYLPNLRDKFVAQSRELINCGMDISDGLFCDTNKLLNTNKYGLLILKDISPKIGESGEEYEMLISFNIKNKTRILEIASALDLKLTIFAKACSKNNFRYPCKSHHF